MPPITVDNDITDITAIYAGTIVDKSFQIRITNPRPAITYTHQHNPYPSNPSDYMSYYTFNASRKN